MREVITYVYNYLNYKPELGILSALSSYLIAVKVPMQTDELLKLIGTVSTCAGCLVACLSALSMLVKTILYLTKTYQSFKNNRNL
ncbi:hypothetical protein [Mucilaginibacter terrae]|uniref:Uncharacterized protein n=1 Tax=Mucilaginibacter terrae TaxID=1955052 RepID=A0ABU3GZA1_9SPHI|nr:hypothetical protein [Mucilaginibacter terrae]MDT3405092.1 hypothetical protein [Mucilaginibacter terrae]